MIWLIDGKASYQIQSCNIHEENGKSQLWVTRANGKSIKVRESSEHDEIAELKSAIDFAVNHGATTFDIGFKAHV